MNPFEFLSFSMVHWSFIITWTEVLWNYFSAYRSVLTQVQSKFLLLGICSCVCWLYPVLLSSGSSRGGAQWLPSSGGFLSSAMSEPGPATGVWLFALMASVMWPDSVSPPSIPARPDAACSHLHPLPARWCMQPDSSPVVLGADSQSPHMPFLRSSFPLTCVQENTCTAFC